MSVIAVYHSVCTECEDPIIPGERIESADGEWRHVSCGQPTDKVACACSTCFLVHAPMQAVCW